MCSSLLPSHRPPFSQTFELDWLRHRLTSGRTLALPSHLLRLVEYAGFETHDRGPGRLQDVLSIACCEDLSRENLDFGSVTYFKITNCFPNRRVLEHPWHLGARPNVISITCYDVESVAPADGQAVLVPRARAQYLDLMYLCSDIFTEVLQSLWSFGTIEYGGKLMVKPHMLRALGDSPAPLPSITKSDRSMALSVYGHLEAAQASPAHKLVSHLLSTSSFSELGKFIQATL